MSISPTNSGLEGLHTTASAQYASGIGSLSSVLEQVQEGHAAQLRELQRHLRTQYADRAAYWAHRSRSRLEASSTCCSEVSIILDSMDQAKHCWPRSEAMAAKDFNSWPRPKMSSTTMIMHGHGVIQCLSPPCLPTNSNRTVEIAGVGLTRGMAHGIDWRHVDLRLQSDNCAKEAKNQTVLRFLGQLVATHRLRSARLCCLMTGHSHEGIDSLFSQMSTFIGRNRELHTMSSFRDAMRRLFSDAHVRPHDNKFREVEIVTAYRDWIFSLNVLDTRTRNHFYKKLFHG